MTMRRPWIVRALALAAAAACGGDAPTAPPPPPVPTQLSMVTQPGASVQNGGLLAPQPAVRLRDAQGLPVALAGVAVQVQLTAGGAALSGTATATTDGNGVATFATLRLTGTVGAYTLQFTSGSLAAATANAVTLTPGPATALAIVQAPSTAAQAGTALAQQPQVRLKDQSGNDATGAGTTVTASLVAPGAATLSNATAVTTAAGLATFSGLALSGTVGTYTLRFTAPNLTAVDAPAATVLAAGPATQLALAVQPSATLINGGTLAVQPVVELRDQFQNVVLVPGTVVTASILTGTGTLAGTPTATTDSLGRATFTGLGITGTAGVFTLRFQATGVTSAVSNGITLTAGAATKVQVTTLPPFNATNGVALTTQPVVQVQDGSGNAVAGAGVAVTAGIIATGGGPLPAITNGTATTDAAGNATFSGLTLTGLAANYLLTFSAAGLAPDTSPTPTLLQAGAATQLVMVRQPATAAVNGVPLPALQQPVVRLQDISGNNVAQANVVVTASLATGSATLTHAAESTAANGVATFDSLTITGFVGGYSLRFSASSAGVAGVDASAPTTLSPGAATQLTLVTQPASVAQSGVALVVQPVAQLRDVSGNAVPDPGETVTASVITGSASLAGATATTNAGGTATFTALTLSGAPGPVSLRFSAPSVTPADAAPVGLGAGPAAALTVTAEPPAAAQSGIALTTQPVVQLRDATGNAVPLAGVVVTASLVSGSLTLAGATATTNPSGTATFSTLTLAGVTGSYRLRFSAPGMGSVDAAGTTALSAGTASAVTLTTPPSTLAQSGTALAQQPVAQLRDGAGNPVPQSGIMVTASLVSGTLTLASATATTDGAGAAAFAGLTLTGAVGSYTLRFTATGVGSVTAPAPTLLAAGAADHLALTTQPSTGAQNGVTLARQPVVQVRDAAGNVVTTSAAVVTVSTTAGVALANGSAGASSGVATFSGLTLTGTAGSYLLAFASTGLTGVNAAAPTVLGVGAPAGMTLSPAPSGAAQNGIVLAQQPSVVVTDQSGNLVAGTVVTATADNGGTVLNGTATTNGAGVAAFSGMAVVGTAGAYTLTFTAGAASTTAPLTLSAGAAAAISVTTQPSTSAASGTALGTQPVVHVQDISANPVQGAVVSASLTSAGATVVNATAVTNASGNATFAGLALSGTVGSYTLRFAAGGLAPVPAAAATALAAGPAAKLVLTTQPSASVQNGVALASQPVVRVTDAAGNNVAQVGTLVTASVAGGGPSVANGTATTAAGGIATFGALSLTGTIGSYTLRFTAPGLDSADAAAPTALLTGTATQLALTTQPSGSAQSGVALAQQPALQLRDVGGNAVALEGVDVTASVVGGAATVSGAVATTGPAGSASYAALAVAGPVGPHTLRFAVGGLGTVDAAAPTVLEPGPPASLVIVTAPPATAVNGTPLTPDPVVEVRDGAANPVPDVALAVAAPGNVAIAPATATSAANGRATFTGLTLTGTAAAYTLQFCVGPCASAAIGVGAPQATVLQAGAPATMTVQAAPSASAQSGVALPGQPVVVVKDATGNPVPGVTVTASAAGASVSGGSIVTDGAGVAAFTALTVSGAPAGYILALASGAATASSSLLLAVGPAASVTFTQAPPAGAQNGVVFGTQPAVLVKDATDNVVQGALVTVTADNAGAVLNGTAMTNAAGVATFANLALSGLVGPYTLTFTSGAATATAGLALAAGSATAVSITQQPSTTAANGAVLATQPVVRVQDVSGNAVPGAVVTASLTAAGATVVNANAITNAAGNAVFSGLSLAGSTGSYTMQFAVSGLAPATASAATVLGPGPAAKLAITTPPSASAQNGAALAIQPVVRVTDAGGNLVPQNGTVITASVVGGGPALANASAATAGGSAAFGGLAMTGTVGTYVLRFTAPGLDSVDAAATVLQPGAATQLVLATQPGVAAQSGVALGQQPVVHVLDQSGNLVTGSSATVTATTTAGVTLANASVAAASGIAAFSGLTLSGTAGNYLLSFASSGVAGVSASALTAMSAGPAAQLTLTTQPPALARSGIALSQQPVVQLRDAAGNPVPGSGIAVTASVVGGGATPAFATVTTNPSGTAVFDSLAVSGAVGAYTLRFAVAGVGQVDAAAPLTLEHGAPATIVLVTPPPASAVNGVALAPAPVVEIQDGAGNPVPDSVVTADAFGAVALTAASATAGANGRATFTGLTLTGAVSGYNLRFCVGPCVSAAVVVAAPQPTALQPGAPDTVAITTAPSAAAQSGIALAAQPVVVVTDISGNPVPGVTVTASAAGATVAGGSIVSDSTGTATFTALTVSGAPAAYALQFTAGSAVSTSPLALAVGPVATVALTQAPSANGQNGIVLVQQPIVHVEDATGNPIAGTAVNVTTGAGATVLHDTATTDASGNAAFSGMALTGAVGGYTLTFTAGAVTTTAPLALAAGPATVIALTQQPSVTATNGAALAVQPVVNVVDGAANPVSGAVVTASLTTGGATVASATAVTSASGDATFNGLALFGTVGSYTLQFAVAGLAPVQAAAATALAAGPPAALTFTTAPSASAVNAAVLGTQPVLQIRDAGGNPVAPATTTVTATLTATGASLTNASASSAGDGSVTFGALTATGLVGAYTVRFAAPGLDSVEAPLTLTYGAATGLALVTQPSHSTPAGVVLARQPVARLRDISGNTVPLAGVPVAVTSSSVSAVLQGTSTLSTDAAGLATFTDLAIAGPRGRHLLSFASAGYGTVVAAETTVVAQALADSVPVSDSAKFDEENPYVFEVLPGDTLLVVQIGGGSGSADLVVRYGEVPDTDHGVWDCRPRLAGSDETCTFRNPTPGLWYVTVLAFPFSYAGVILTVHTSP